MLLEKFIHGSESECIIEINPTTTSVAVRYDIEIGEVNLITIESIRNITANTTLTETGENVFSGVITLADIKNGIKPRLQIKLHMEDTEEAAQTALNISATDESLLIPLNIRFSQYLGESL